MGNYYTYQHREGYGSDDHMADEIICRAARQLGIDTGTAIAAAVGLASHAVGDSHRVEIPSGPGVAARMRSALRRARQEVGRNDCCIEVVCMRYLRTDDGIAHQIRRGREWVTHNLITAEVL